MADPFGGPALLTVIGPIVQFVMRDTTGTAPVPSDSQPHPITNNNITSVAGVNDEMRANVKDLIKPLLKQIQPDLPAITDDHVDLFLLRFVFCEDWETGNKITMPRRKLIRGVHDVGYCFGTLLEDAAASRPASAAKKKDSGTPKPWRRTGAKVWYGFRKYRGSLALEMKDMKARGFSENIRVAPNDSTDLERAQMEAMNNYDSFHSEVVHLYNLKLAGAMFRNRLTWWASGAGQPVNTMPPGQPPLPYKEFELIRNMNSIINISSALLNEHKQTKAPDLWPSN